jgi:hypothetical protein
MFGVRFPWAASLDDQSPTEVRYRYTGIIWHLLYRMLYLEAHLDENSLEEISHLTNEDLMRKQLQKALGQQKWEENPLVTIGLTHAILSLNLTDKHLFRVVHSYVRQLAAAVHPDNAGPSPTVQVHEHRKIMAAFEYLDNESNFLMALDEFRTLKAEDQHEIAILRAALRVAHEQLERANENIAKLGEARRQLRLDIGEFNRKQAEAARPRRRN